MFEFINIYQYACAGVFLLSLVAFFDVFIKFKTPLLLKTLMLIMILCIGVFVFGQIFVKPINYLRLLTELPAQILVLAYINFLYQLYSNKLSRLVFLSCLLLLFSMLIFPLYSNYKFGISIYNSNYYLDPRTSNEIKLIRIFFHFYFLCLGLYFLLSILKKYKKSNLYNVQLRKWCSVMIITLLIALVFSGLKVVFPTMIAFKYLSLFFTYFAPLLIFMYRPAFLNKIPLNISLLNIFSPSSIQPISTEKFTNHFFIDLYYLKENANLSNFTETIGESPEALNYHIKTYFNISFTDLVNKNRILYFLDIVTNPESKNFTLEALAKQSGFKTRQNMAFFFKKFHGGSPSEYVKLIQNKQF